MVIDRAVDDTLGGSSWIPAPSKWRKRGDANTDETHAHFCSTIEISFWKSQITETKRSKRRHTPKLR